MKKRIYTIISAVTLLALGGALALSHTDKLESLLFRNMPNRAPNTFVIDEDTDFSVAGYDDEDDPIYQGVAISEQNSLTTMFSGFELNSDKLSVSQYGVGFFMNTDPMNRGFNGVYTKFSGTGNFNFNIMLYFSYFELDPIGVLTGGYGDLQTIGSVQVTANQLAENNFTSTDLPGMEACRYVLGVVFSTDGTTLEELRFSTPCIETVPEVQESDFDDYRASDKAIMMNTIGEVIPFFGFGGYHFNNDGTGYGVYFMDDLAQPFIEAIYAAGYEVTSEESPTSITDVVRMYIQKKVTVAGEPVIRTMIVDYCPFLYSFKLELTTEVAYIGAYDTWPASLFNEVFNYDDFADTIIDNPFEETGITFVAREYNSGSDTNSIQLKLDGYDTETEEARALIAYLKEFVQENDGWSVYGVPFELPEGEDIYSGYEYEIHSGPYRIVLRYNEREGVFLQFREQKLLDTYPTEQVNAVLGLTGTDSIIPYTGTGKFKIYDNSSYVYVYLSDMENAIAYAQLLANSGFRYSENYSSEYVLVNEVFDSYQVRIYFSSLEYDEYFSIGYERCSLGTEYSSFQAALEAYTSESLARNHVYPELSGEHTYKTITTEYTYQPFAKGIYISGLTSSYLNSLIGSAEYNAYYDAYQFEDDGNGNCLFISVEEVSGGVKINPFVVSNPVTLYNSSDANALLLAQYEAHYPDGTQHHADALASRVDLPNSNGEKIYLVSSYTTNVAIYGANSRTVANQYFAAIESHGYDVSDLQKHYVYGTTGFNGSWSISTNTYGVSFSTFHFTYDSSVNPLIHFVAHDDANLASIESVFAEFPHNGAEEIFYNDGYNYVVTDDTFDDVAFSNALIANGFERHDTTDYYYFVKDNGTAYYRVDHYNSYGTFNITEDDGYHVYYFTTEASHYCTFNEILAAASASGNPVPTTIVNALPSFNSLGTVFNYGGADSQSFWARFSSQTDLNAFATATMAAGFKKEGSSSFTYSDGENFYIYISINTSYKEISVRYRNYQWTTTPDVTECSNTILYKLQDHILFPDETGNVFYFDRAYCRNNSSSWMDFYLRPSLVDIEDYVEKLVNNGFTLQSSGNNYWDLEKYIQGEKLYIYINLDHGVYRVNCSYNNNNFVYSANSSDIEATLAADSWNVSFADSNVVLSIKEWSYYFNSDMQQANVFVYFENASATTAFLNALLATGDYTETISGSSHWLTKTEGGLSYTIYFYDESITMYVSTNV